jgi:signal transduction histidine kinase
MVNETSRRPPWPRWLSFLGLWTLLALFTASRRIIAFASSGRAISWHEEVLSHLGAWYVWALLSLVIMHLARRFPLERRTWRRALAVHLPASAIVAFAHIVIDYMPDRLLHVPGTETFRAYVLAYYQFNILTYWVILGIGSAFDYHRRYRERELRASQLEARLAQAQLQVLKMQLHPHFLFNTLHAVSALMHRDVAAADLMLARLSDLLRVAIVGDDSQEVPLRKEIEFIERYLEIMRIRFGDRLDVTLAIAPEALDVRVPNLFLQPLVENAIRHGVSRRVEGGHVELRTRFDDGILEILVRDDGPGLPDDAEAAMRRGLGLSNTRARLEHLYGPRHRFRVESRDEGGVEVTVGVPVGAPVGTVGALENGEGGE